MSRRLQISGGFTLAEVLVATTLLSIVMASVYVMFNSSIRQWRLMEGSFDNYLNARAAMGVFERELENIVDEASFLFHGKNDEISMIVTAEPMDVEESEGRHMMQVEYRYNRADHELIREEALLEMALPNQPPEGEELDHSKIKLKRKHEFVVAVNVRDFDIKYIWLARPPERNKDQPPEETKRFVVDEHEEGWGLPQGIEVRMTLFDPEDEEREHVFTVKHRIHAPTYPLLRDELEKRLGDLL